MMMCWRIAVSGGCLMLAVPAAATGRPDPACPALRGEIDAGSRAAAGARPHGAPIVPSAAPDGVACPPATLAGGGTGRMLCLALLATMLVAGSQASRRRSARSVFS